MLFLKLKCLRIAFSAKYVMHECIRPGQTSPEQGSIQVAGVQVPLDAFLPALVELPGLISIHRRSVLLHAFAPPLCKGFTDTEDHSNASITADIPEQVRRQPMGCHTYGVASFHLIDRRFRGGESGIPPTVTKLHKQTLVGRATKASLPEVAAVCSSRKLLVLTHTHTHMQRQRHKHRHPV